MEGLATPIFGTTCHESREFQWPELDVIKRYTSLIVRLKVAGMKQEEMSVTVADSLLRIEGTCRYAAEKRTYRFVRSVQLPDGVRATEIRAMFEHGVLEVEIPLPFMATAATPYRVTIGRDPTAAVDRSAA